MINFEELDIDFIYDTLMSAPDGIPLVRCTETWEPVENHAFLFKNPNGDFCWTIWGKSPDVPPAINGINTFKLTQNSLKEWLKYKESFISYYLAYTPNVISEEDLWE